jgi:hypothetical protein
MTFPLFCFESSLLIVKKHESVKRHRREEKMVEEMAISTPEHRWARPKMGDRKHLAILTLNSMPYECWDAPIGIGGYNLSFS